MRALLAYLEVFVRPRAAFERMRPARKWLWAVGLALLIILAALKTWTQVPFVLDKLEGVPAGMAAAQSVTATFAPGAESSAVPGVVSKKPPSREEKVLAVAAHAALQMGGLILGLLATVLLFWAFARAWRIEGATFMFMLSMVVVAKVPVMLRDLVLTLYMLISGKPALAGFGSLVTATKDPLAALNILQALLARIDVWGVWSMLLMGAGLLVAGLKPKRMVLVIVIFALGSVLLGAIPALAVSALM